MLHITCLQSWVLYHYLSQNDANLHHNALKIYIFQSSEYCGQSWVEVYVMVSKFFLLWFLTTLIGTSESIIGLDKIMITMCPHCLASHNVHMYHCPVGLILPIKNSCELSGYPHTRLMFPWIGTTAAGCPSLLLLPSSSNQAMPTKLFSLYGWVLKVLHFNYCPGPYNIYIYCILLDKTSAAVS